jgi:hypothetical protein
MQKNLEIPLDWWWAWQLVLESVARQLARNPPVSNQLVALARPFLSANQREGLATNSGRALQLALQLELQLARNHQASNQVVAFPSRLAMPFLVPSQVGVPMDLQLAEKLASQLARSHQAANQVVAFPSQLAMPFLAPNQAEAPLDLQRAEKL